MGGGSSAVMLLYRTGEVGKWAGRSRRGRMKGGQVIGVEARYFTKHSRGRHKNCNAKSL